MALVDLDPLFFDSRCCERGDSIHFRRDCVASLENLGPAFQVEEAIRRARAKVGVRFVPGVERAEG